MATRTIYLVRHGEYDWDDRPSPVKGLTERGVEQTRLTAKRLRSVPATAIYSSDLQRAVETAEIIRGVFDGVRYEKRRNLRECIPAVPGDLIENRLFSRFSPERLRVGEQHAAAAFAKYFRPTRGEDKHEIVVSHGNLIRYLVSRILTDSGDGWVRMRTLNCGISEVAIDSDGRIQLASYNDVGHLSPTLTTAGVPSGSYTQRKV